MVAFSLLGFPIYRYGIFYLISFILLYFFLKFVAHTKLFKNQTNLQNLLENNSEDIILYCVIGVLLGGRLGHIFIYNGDYYLNNPLEILAIRKGGMSFIGGMIGVLTSLFFLKKFKNLSFKELILLLDCLLAFVPFGIMIGRLGNYLNQELYGILVPSGLASTIGYVRFSLFKTFNIFHVYPAVDNFLRVNTNLISSLSEGLMLLIITFGTFLRRVKTKKYHTGQVVGLFLTFYSLFRFLIEYIRDDSQREYVLMLTKSQRFFIIFFLIGVLFLIRPKFLKFKD